MAATLQELESRVQALERELCDFREKHQGTQAAETPAQRGARMLAIAEANRGVSSAQLRQMLSELGINGEPIGAENVQAMMLAEGVRPEDCILSREIIAMREE